jgi:lysine 2,3-aminomutase
MTKLEHPKISNHIAKFMIKSAIARQYTPISELETLTKEKPFEGRIKTGINGTERMYKSEMIILATSKCAARCVACIRKNYRQDDVISRGDLEKLANYVDKEKIKEVLITGGDPLTNQKYTIEIIDSLLGTKLKHIRIGTAMLRANPQAVSCDFITELKKRNKTYGFLEVSPHFDHPLEFSNETINKIKQFNDAGIRLYVQTILLRDVNDEKNIFKELAEKIRDNGMEWHYLYHCVPVNGNLHLRTKVEKGFELMDSLENHQETTGRHIPKCYVIPSPIGKIYLDKSRLLEHEGDYIWIETRYTLDSLRGTSLPNYCRVGKTGFIEVKYLDGRD